MSRTHKDRHKWKKKERKRERSRDPKKIRTHRNRFVSRVRQSKRVFGTHASMLFRLHFEYIPENQTTQIIADGDLIEEVPFLIQDVNDGHYAIEKLAPNFNSTLEQKKLTEHVNRVRFRNTACRLCASSVCTSVISCKYRKWDDERSLPLCTLLHK